MDVFDQHVMMMNDRLEALEREGVKVFKMSTTEREEFKRCRRRWDFASLSRQGLEPKKPAIQLWFGTGIHRGLEVFYREQKNPVEEFEQWAKTEVERIRQSQNGLWDEQVQELENTIELGKRMLENYVAWASIEDSTSENGFTEVLYTEREFQTPILDPSGNPARFIDRNGQVWEMHLVGRLDMVVRDHYGKIWLMDHKTSKDKLDPQILILNDQMTVYLWAAQQIFKMPFEGAFYNVLRKKLPTVPQLLKTGSLSKSKQIDTTYEVYLAEIEKHGFNPEDYRDILEHLQEKPNTFFQREKVRRNQHEIATAGRLLFLEAIDMLNDPFIYTNMTWDCRWDCDFAQLCKAMNRNDDVDWLLRAMYQKRQSEGVYDRIQTIE